eukprot:1152316-Pelagomonas_calceolata.AAC.4
MPDTVQSPARPHVRSPPCNTSLEELQLAGKSSPSGNEVSRSSGSHNTPGAALLQSKPTPTTGGSAKPLAGLNPGIMHTPADPKAHLQGSALHVLDAFSCQIHAYAIAAGEAEAAGPVIDGGCCRHLRDAWNRIGWAGGP